MQPTKSVEADPPRAPELAAMNPLVRSALIALGALLVGIGVLGIFLPLLPTTVFFLGAAACFGKSSPTAYRWLTTNRWFGSYLRNYREERGMTLISKAVSIATLWIGIVATALWLRPPMLIDGLLLVIAAGVTWHLLALATLRRIRETSQAGEARR